MTRKELADSCSYFLPGRIHSIGCHVNPHAQSCTDLIHTLDAHDRLQVIFPEDVWELLFIFEICAYNLYYFFQCSGLRAVY